MLLLMTSVSFTLFVWCLDAVLDTWLMRLCVVGARAVVLTGMWLMSVLD